MVTWVHGMEWAGFSVQKAKIGTQDNVVSDVFYVVDAGTKAPLLESQWEVVRNRLLARISERHQLLHASPL
jgi:UTP:GlnB (protein PII) uridylyltransferase